MFTELSNNSNWLPYTFAFLIGLSMLLYAILDGYDLGVGMLSQFVEDNERERMIASIGPFWDANETWLVLGVGLLLVAFPAAHGIVLTSLYLPVAFMIIALIFRGVSFDFRKKAPPKDRATWNRAFSWSSLLISLTQGYMLGRFITGFQQGVYSELFAIFFGFLVVAGYLLMGSCWLILKTENELQKKAVSWAKKALWSMVIGAILSSLTAVFVDTRIYDRMFSFPELTLLIAMPLASMALTLIMHFILGVLPLEGDRLSWMPFAISVFIFILGFTGLVYSFYPYIVPGHLKITDGASAGESLAVILIGTAIVFPFLIGYTFLAYRIFNGKAQDLTYN
ncbi:cytochrome d ubiquinol oxidase subunit II [Puniceicoccaceae bacterium K14]|nr:cytochrome d ubiquinol oxidase subunit II [Puniceicoccaceae bacterium K14]